MSIQAFDLFGTIGLDSSSAESGLGRVSAKLDAFGVATGNLIATGITKLTGSLVSMGESAVTTAGDFEAGMLNFQAVAGKDLDAKGLQQFHDLFISLGKELPVSTSEVQQAATELVKGGIDPATVAAGGLRQTLQFAAAGGLSLADAATIAAKAVGGWVNPLADAAAKANFLAHSTDLLQKAANASTVDVDDLALGLYNVQGTAKLAGVSFDETVTTLAEMAPAFASSADAGTSLKVMLSRLQPTTKAQTAAMRELGLLTSEGKSRFYDAQGSFIGMAQAADLLHTATAGLSEAQREQALQAIFGQDAIRAAAVLADQGRQGYDAMTASLAGQNSVAEMAAAKQQGFNVALDNMKGSVEALAITVGEKLLPYGTKLLNDWVAPAINQFTDFASAVLESDDPLGMIGQKIEELGGQAIGAVQAALPGILATLGRWGQAFLDWIAPLVPPLLAKAGELVGRFGRWIGDQVPGVLKWLGGWADSFVAWVLPAAQRLVEQAGPLIDGLGRWIRDVGAPWLGEHLASWTEAFLKWIGPAAAKFILWAGERLPEVVKALAGWIKAAGEWFGTKGVPLLLEAVGTIGVAVIGKIQQLWKDAFAEGSLGRHLVDSIKNGISNAWEGIKNWVAQKWHDLLGVFAPGGTPSGSGAASGGSVPGFASGVTSFAGGLALVGERGPELVQLPRGSSVLPAPATAAALGGGGVYVGQIVVNGAQDPVATARAVRQELLRYQQRNGAGSLGWS